MKYAFRFTSHARRQLRGIGQLEAMRVLTALTALGDDPFADGPDVKKLAGNDALYRLRVGDFRVVYQVRGEVLVILVVHVGHRREVYRGL
ncbi:plasmid stabilization protein [Streptomyces rubellomurinus subsp. indigoferus]|uniref:Plasmid stabilization protein n=1 Tax=Streptomyces rubellomurinus (strain ATCC 31215) TaxID=359131 RepID=A0A0F2TA32_STRR3|nr:type II toxin-antitoxin system RelE/ParE family toxin [Streptomyces rubellomurinus]KJS54630.1 plasmid stabilization protein [Streptomyces rubellomurinus subsp. indigoferus]KJS59170.1 plasmid stabilization protein [Streptomyces rubellomurinus]